MLQVAEAKVGERAGVEIENIYNGLFKEWLNDLTAEEKEIWLWNALVEMVRIKQRRKL